MYLIFAERSYTDLHFRLISETEGLQCAEIGEHQSRIGFWCWRRCSFTPDWAARSARRPSAKRYEHMLAVYYRWLPGRGLFEVTPPVELHTEWPSRGEGHPSRSSHMVTLGICFPCLQSESIFRRSSSRQKMKCHPSCSLELDESTVCIPSAEFFLPHGRLRARG
jgi:hypothetical protein